ncbi:CaiB/BaiF CoA transferase family protein [Chloroflexota bacterium]
MVESDILSGIRILDFTWVLAGPYATRVLADFGAEVIKIQPKLQEAEDTPFSRGYYRMWNRNKRGITLDPGQPEGAALVKKLAAKCDVIIENFTPRVMANWGLDYDTLRAVRPDIIMVGMSALGCSGPLRDYTGFAPTAHAISGMTGLTAYPGGPPLGPGFAYADHAAGLFAALAILSALEHRQKTGLGQYIDISETEVMVNLLGEAVVEHTLGVGAQKRAVLEGVYPCRGDDRWCAITVATDEEWAALRRVPGIPGWVEEERFANASARQANREELDKLLAAWTSQHTAEEVIHLLQAAGVAVGVVSNAADILRDPQLAARGFFVKTAHSEAGNPVGDAVPLKFSRSRPSYERPAPTRGQDNDYVYRELLNLDEDKIKQLEADGVI